jgi:WD40 repeat protein
MDTPRHSEYEQAPGDFEVEIIKLDPVDDAKTGLSSRFSRILLNWQRPENKRRRRMMGISGTILLSLLIILLSFGPVLSSFIVNNLRLNFTSVPGLVSNSYSSSESTSNGPTIPQQDGLACLVDAAWSPDGNSIAVLGYTQKCPQGNFVTARVNIYDVHTGKLALHWTPDYAIARTLSEISNVPARLRAIAARKPLPGSNGGFVSLSPIYYSRILWSPDGQNLALIFTASTRLGSFGGVLLIASVGNPAKVFLQHQDNINPVYTTWNTSSGQPIKSAPAPAAIFYRWGSDGSLQAQRVLKTHSVAAAPPLAPIGNTGGGNFFTIWQPGQAITLSQAHSPAVYIWKTSITAWSPGGKYLVANMNLKALLESSDLPFPDPSFLAALNLQHTPLLPAHDTALLRAIAGSLALAWRPDGQVLAAANFTGSVDFFDCATGQKLGTLFTPMNHTPISGSATILRWAPDSTHLLLSSAQWGILNVWNTAQLTQG